MVLEEVNLNVNHMSIWKIKQRQNQFHSIEQFDDSRGQKISITQQDGNCLRERPFVTSVEAHAQTSFLSSVWTALVENIF